MTEPLKDCRGVPIEVGCTVVTAISGDRLMERTVTRLELPGAEGTRYIHPMGHVWCGGFWTTSDRVVVVR